MNRIEESVRGGRGNAGRARRVLGAVVTLASMLGIPTVDGAWSLDPIAGTSSDIEKNITVDARNGFIAQISQIEQSFTVSPIPEPTSALLFGFGGLVAGARLRRAPPS